MPENPVGTIQNIPLTDLLLDPENYRLEPQATQLATIHAMIAEQEEKLGGAAVVSWSPIAIRRAQEAGGVHHMRRNRADGGTIIGIAEAEVGDILSTRFNGMFAIESVLSPKKFTYLMSADPGGNADASPAPKFGALWRIGRWIIENNTIDLVGTITPGFDPPIAIRLERTASNPVAPTSPYVCGQIVVIANVIRMIENAFDTSTNPLGIKLNNCEQAVVEDNVINLTRTTPIEFVACGAIKFFNNQSPSGKLLQGYDVTNSRLMNELETDVDLAAVSVM